MVMGPLVLKQNHVKKMEWNTKMENLGSVMMDVILVFAAMEQ
jgi:hypothetical protein